MSKIKIFTVVGTRPQFLKIDTKLPNQTIIHTGQHYDFAMSQQFFKELALPKPLINLHCTSEETGKMIDKLSNIFKKRKPNMVIVHGDTNSALAGALAAAYSKIPVAHIEAGCRIYDRSMPEEINRVLIDELATVRFATTLECYKNLINEKKQENSYYVKGDPMFDAMNKFTPIKRTKQYQKYYLLTIHRDFNTDNYEQLRNIIALIGHNGFPCYFPCHPRTQKVLKMHRFTDWPKNIKVMEPVNYKKMLQLESNAKKIITDSGGVQREAYWMQVPCIILRAKTEWQYIVNSGWAVLVDPSSNKLITELKNFDSPSYGYKIDFPVFGVHKRIREKLYRYL